jgi:proteasome lid subunit RPN8/RPN11
MITLNHTSLHRIKIHAMQTYPEECCGALLGTHDGDAKSVCDVLEIKNALGEHRSHRYLVTPEDYTRAEERATKAGVSIVGFYHSHPDHPAEPSQFDLEHAMPWWSYVVVSVESKLPTVMRSWLLKVDRTRFSEKKLEISDGEFKHPCK